MSKHNDLYNILNKLGNLDPKKPTKTAPSKPVYESVDAKGSILAGVTSIEKKLAEAYTAEKAINKYAVGMAAAKKQAGITKTPAHDLPKSVITKGHEIAKKIKEGGAEEKKYDTNPKNAQWDAAALTAHKRKLASQGKQIAMQRKISGQDSGLPPVVKEGNPTSDPWIAYDKENTDKIKKFKTRDGAKAYADKKGWGIASFGHYHDHVKGQQGVAEGWDDMIKAGKDRDAEANSGKKPTATGVKHHGKYGTEYQGDAGEEEAAEREAEQGVKKRGRPVKHLAKHKAKLAAQSNPGEKKGRGRPPKAAAPTYSAAKGLQDFIVGNLPKGKPAKTNTLKHSLAESRIMDESGQALKHILNRFKHEVRKFEQGGELDEDLYHALFDYWNDMGEIPYGVQKARTGDPHQWVMDNLDSHLSGGGIVGGNPDEDEGLERESVEMEPPAAIDTELNELAKLAGLSCGSTDEEEVEEARPRQWISTSGSAKGDIDKAHELAAKRDATTQAINVSEADDSLDEDDMDEGNAFGAAIAKAKADGAKPGEKVKVGDKEYAIKEAEEMIAMMKNAGLDTTRAEAALAEAKQYGETAVEEAPEHDNTPDPEYHSIKSITQRGGDLNRSKSQYAGKPKAGDNPMDSDTVNEAAAELEAMSRQLMRTYESIKAKK
jgi:hypothetical protein